MMKPFQVRSSRYLYVRLSCADGVRLTKSTMRTSLREAEMIGSMLQVAENLKREAGGNPPTPPSSINPAIR
jgi:hypothetical protein